MVHIIIRGLGHGDSTLDTPPILDGDLAGVMVQAGSVSDLVSVTAMDTVMDMVTMDVAGGVRPITIPPVGVDGTEVRILMDIMEIISTYIIMFTSTTRIMYTEIVEVYPARIITEPAAWLQEQ
jgi:hypothetical protein